MTFCEGKYGGLFRGQLLEKGEHLPEYGNCTTAFVIMWTGAHMLIFWDGSVFLRAMSATFAVNGAASFALHAVGKCGRADLYSMTMCAVLNFAYTTEELVKRLLLGLVPRHARLCRMLATAVTWLSIMTFFWLFVVNRDLWENENGRVAMDVVPSLTFVVAVSGAAVIVGVIGHVGRLSPECVPSETLRQMLRLYRLGIFMCLSGTVMHLLSESGCEHSDFAKWFPGHAVYHILLSVGLMYLLLLMSAIRADSMHRRLVLLPAKTHGMYFAVFPAFHFEAVAPLIERQEASPQCLAGPCELRSMTGAAPSRCQPEVLGAGQAEEDGAAAPPGPPAGPPPAAQALHGMSSRAGCRSL